MRGCSVRIPITPERLGFDDGKSNVFDGNFSDTRMSILVGKHGNSVLSVFFCQKIVLRVN